MIGFLIALLAGFLTPKLEKPVGQPVANLLQNFIKVDPTELRVFTYMILQLFVLILAAILSYAYASAVVIGMIFGYFAMRIVDAIRRLINS